jgi:UDP-glucose 4-epimerase
MENILVTGGCGFIGSHLVDKLVMEDKMVTVLDNLSSGSLKNIGRWERSRKFHFIKEDLIGSVLKIPDGCDAIFHMAANPDVRLSSRNPSTQFEQNIVGTFNLLEATRKSGAKLFAFGSTSTVYGEAGVMPTPENSGPLRPISIYGASKLACEALISSYAYTYGLRAVIFRLANIIGARSTHGIIHDFLQKLKENPLELEILGDGTQTKSYLHVQDCVTGIFTAVEKTSEQVSIFNIGSEDQINVMRIAEIVSARAGLSNVKYKMNSSTPDGRGWPGDVKFMLLDVSKLKTLGWKPTMNSEEAVVRAVQELI